MKGGLIDISTYRERLNLQDASFFRIYHEDAMVAVVYKVTKANGIQLILKVCDRKKDYLREVHFLKCLANEVPIPRIIQIVSPEEGIHGAILMECLSGGLLEANKITEPLAQELGRCLALIHNHRLSGYGDPIDEKLSNDPQAYFTFKFEEGMDECKHHLPSNLIEKCQKYYSSHLHLLSDVDGPCIVHRDFRPGNLMVHEGKLQGIIDWAGARASFAEEDFCSLEHGTWLNQHMTHFLSGYASIRPSPQYRHLIPFLRLNKAIATIGFTVKRGTWDTTDTRLYQFNRQFIDNLVSK